jgi:hypothetical protein
MIQRVERWIVAQISHGTPGTIGYSPPTDAAVVLMLAIE